MPTLYVRASGRLAQTLELKAGLNRIGRAPASELLIEDPTISAQHCEILVEADRVLVRDLGSTNGTFINGQRVAEAMITPGQTLRLGFVEMGYEVPPIHVASPLESPPEAPCPTVLPDGTPCCLNHPGIPASRVCVQCEQFFCTECVRELRRVGGKPMMLCPACNGPCQALAAEAGVSTQLTSWFGSISQKLKQTFRITRPPPRRRRRR